MRTNNEVVRGELGWETLKARRDELRLRYWRRLTEMTPERIPKILYEESRKRMESEIQEDASLTATWCSYTKDLLEELKLGEYWESNRALGEKEKS